MGNYYKRYIYKNGVKLGPYYYSNKKVNGKVISTYLGTKEPTKFNFKVNPVNKKIVIAFLSLVSIALLIYIAMNMGLFGTGESIINSEATGIITPAPEETINDSNLSVGDAGVDKGKIIEESPTNVINDSNLTIDIPPETDAQIPEEEIEPEMVTEQKQAVINLPVEWRKEVTLPKNGPARVQIPSQATDIVVYSVDDAGNKEEVSDTNVGVTAQASSEIVLKDEEPAIISFFEKIISFFKKIFNFLTGNVVTISETGDVKEVMINENKNKYEINYKTPGPSIIEEETDNGKKVTVSSPLGLQYNDVIVYTNIESLGVSDASSISIYWAEQNQYVDYTNLYDTDENGILDYLEWVSPSADNQTYEIIVITRAEHLDSNRNLISDVYDKVKELDDLFTEEIQDSHYVRVTFEKNLTFENDITIFPKIGRGNPRVEVYEENGNEVIVEFSEIIDNEYNKVLLTNLQGDQDTFDLKIVGGSVFFDHIVDPLLTGDGRIVYGESTVVTPRARIWVNSTQSWENLESSLNAAAATIRHVIVKSSPIRDEMLVGIQSTNGQLYIQRWNGSTWSSEWNVTVGDGNLPRFDIVYEKNSGEALVVYGTNVGTTNEIAYRRWDGSFWTIPANYNALRTSGIVQGLAMVSLNNSNDVAVVWGDSNLDLSANYWNGASNVWVAEPASVLSTGVDTLSAANLLTTWSFDLDFESLSGELLIAWGNAAATDISYVTRGAGPGGVWGSVSLATVFAEQSDDLELVADPNSNQILLVHTGANSGADLEAAIWNGAAFPATIDTAIPCAANTVCTLDVSVDTTGAGTSGNAGGWLTDGTNTRAIVTYDDINAAGIDWAVWNPTSGWALQTDCTIACNSQPASGDDKLHRIRMNPFNRAELMFIGVDAISDLYVKKLNLSDTTLTWSSTEPLEVALETLMSSITGFAADFAYNKFIPADTPPSISNPNINATAITQNEYFCLNVTATDVSGVSLVYAEVWNTTSWLNYTMTETGGSCSGTGGDGVYGVVVQGTAIGLWNYSKIYANDTLNNKNVLDFADLTINVTPTPNSPPAVSYVQQPLSANPLELTTTDVVFNVKVSDINGVSDINDTSVRANFSKAGEPTRFGTCSWVNDIDANTANYSCSITMQYYDDANDWIISVNATDLAGLVGINNSGIFTYAELKAIVISQPSSLSWDILNPGQTNVLSNNHPTIINNTGNYGGFMAMTGHNLTGESNPAETIPASSFRVGGNLVSVCTLGSQLQESVIFVPSLVLPRGPGANEQIYYCLTSIPYVSSQAYSAKGASAWRIEI